LLINDVTFVLDESFHAFHEITRVSRELREPEVSTLDDATRQSKQELLEAAQNKAKSYMQLANETVSMLALFTDTLADSFTQAEVVQRLADMVDYNLDSLVGPKQTDLKVDNKEDYHFRPQELVADIVSVYTNLGKTASFRLAVARDGRSYKPANFAAAVRIMTKFALKSPDELAAFQKVTALIEEAKKADEEEETDLGEVPEEFLDPLLYTLMEDPVVLPVSRSVMDRSTIRSHLLSDPHDPFNRTPLKIEDVIDATEIRGQIQAWKRERKEEKAAARKEAASALAGEAMDTTEG